MAKRTLTIEAEYDYDFHLFAICGKIAHSKLCYFINKTLRSCLGRDSVDILVKDGKSSQEISFPLYSFNDKPNDSIWFLHANTCEEEIEENSNELEGSLLFGIKDTRIQKHTLIEEQNKVDYFLQIHHPLSSAEIQEMVKSIKEIKHVLAIYELDISTIKSKENLLIH
jgi:hypothetical protein